MTLLKKLALFVAVFFLLDQSIAWILGHLYQQVKTGPGRYNYIKEHRFDCLIMGSSRSMCYYSDILSEKLGYSVLNIGLDGSALIYSRCLLDLVLVHKVQPTVIILNTDLSEILKSAWSGNYYSMIEKFAPMYGESDYIDNALGKGKPFEFLKYMIASYKYNDLPLSLLVKSFKGNSVYARERSPDEVLKLPLDSETVRDKFGNDLDIDKRKLSVYKDFISVCRNNGITLILVESPLYYPQGMLTQRDKVLEKVMQRIADGYKIPFIRITQETYPIFRDHLLYKDVLHLNDKGSIIFSEILSQRLRAELQSLTGKQ
jgi:hypothetical protein